VKSGAACLDPRRSPVIGPLAVEVTGLKAGDTMILFAVGYGNTTPASPAGPYRNEARTPALPYRVGSGETAAPAHGFLAPGGDSLYQLHVTVPDVGDGNSRIDVSIDGTPTGQPRFFTSPR
jgi:uncharacterized protein (TIGR03437 family)